ncbi:hypothetical protein JCM19232_3944 [Vibrio ishigakensis]|uniref:Uncharacterized protein n=1 Tax=Vibrio ishigakensis TaxID=1481914 RepID=A0A0B8P8X6_9VIBR|nr:hypothetical protein JCM19232_3944 [Vibrio ishigakensis]
MYRDPIDAHGKNINQITEDVRTAMLKRLDKRLEHAQLQLTRFGDEEMWASSFYVEDLLGALPQDPIRLVKSKMELETQFILNTNFQTAKKWGRLKYPRPIRAKHTC